MSGHEVVQSPEGLSEEELGRFTELCFEKTYEGLSPNLQWFLLNVSGTEHEFVSIGQMLKEPAFSFYRALYPQLEDGDVLSLRTTARLDAEAWRDLRVIALNSEFNVGGHWTEFIWNRVCPKIHGLGVIDAQAPPDFQIIPSPMEQSAALTNRIEMGMPREVRMLSGLIVMQNFDDHLGWLESSAEQFSRLPETLGLTDAEARKNIELFKAANENTRHKDILIKMAAVNPTLREQYQTPEGKFDKALFAPAS